MKQTQFLLLLVHLLCLISIWSQISDFKIKHTAFASKTVIEHIDKTAEVLISDDQAKEISTAIFIGDLMLGRHTEYLMSKNGSNYPFINLGFLTTRPAYIIGNFEATVQEKHVKTPDFSFAFSVREEYLAELKMIGLTHLSLANNHANDFGDSTFLNTKRALLDYGITPFGNPQSFSAKDSVTYLTVNDRKVALIALHVLENYPTENELELLMASVRANSESQIVFIHWGNEYKRKQSNAQQKFAKNLASVGVDLIIGHHPHVVQGIEKIGDTLVFYSLGNFIFDQYFSTDVQEGLALATTWNGNIIQVDLLPVSSLDAKAQPRLMMPAQADKFLVDLAKYSSEELSDEILTGTLRLVLPLATSSEMAIMDQ